MLFTLNNGKCVEVIGYDEYVKDYEEQVLPEYKNNAEQTFLDALEEQFMYNCAEMEYSGNGFSISAKSPLNVYGVSFLFFNEEKEDEMYVIKYISDARY